jgi:hypothetical protein
MALAQDAPTEAVERERLPNLSQGQVGLVGPFLWGRAADLGAEARFCDEYGRADAKGEFLWLYQFKRAGRTNPPVVPLHERNNLTCLDPALAFSVQPWHVIINAPHNPATHTTTCLKLMVGYVAKDHRFQHGDNTDLVHLADTARVCLFVPIIRKKASPIRHGVSYDQNDYEIDKGHDQPAFGVFELNRKETIASGPLYAKLAPQRILLDLRPWLEKQPDLAKVMENRSMYRFVIQEGGKWTLQIKPDGRDGLKGGTRAGDWDLTFTESSPGAKPYTVDVSPASTTWALSIFNPGGPEESSEITVRLAPFDRRTGQEAAWPDRSRHIRTIGLGDLDRVLAGEENTPRSRPNPPPKRLKDGQSKGNP